MSEAQESEFSIYVNRDEVAHHPRVGDTIIGEYANEEIKYVVTFVGKKAMLVGANQYKELDVVKFTMTLHGQTKEYTDPRDQFASFIRDLLEPVKFSRQEF